MIFENIRQAFIALSLNIKRTFLTMTGIVIGLCAVVLIVSFGDTVSHLFGEFVMLYDGQNSFGVYISPDYDIIEESSNDYDYSSIGLKDDEIYEIIEGCPAIYDIFRFHYGYTARAYSDSKELYSKIEMKGVSPGIEKNETLHMVCGRFISHDDDKYKKKSAVISDKTAEEVFGSAENAIGKTIILNESEPDLTEEDMYSYYYNKNNQLVIRKWFESDDFFVLDSDEFTVVGVYDFSSKNKSQYEGKDRREYCSEVYVPFSYVNSTSDWQKTYYDSMHIITPDNASKPAATAYISEYLEERKKEIGPYQYDVYDFAEDDKKLVENVVLIFTAVFVLISSVSLVVGGIGLMNTMLVSVTERTKEIGIKKALGAKNGEIRIQFLTEAAVICLTASAIGIVLAFFIGMFIETKLDILNERIETLSSGVAYFLKNQKIHFTPSAKSIIVSTVFSLTVGIVFGLYPANKGAKMQPVDALRYE